MSIQNTLTQMQNDTNQLQYANGQKNLGKNSLDPNAFLQLLTAQLQYQDPTNPTDSSQLVSQESQLGQMQAVQQLTSSINTSNSITQASSLVGKYVTVNVQQTDGSYVPATGHVDSVSFDGSGAAVVIGGQTYPMSQVQQIYASDPNAAANTGTGTGGG